MWFCFYKPQAEDKQCLTPLRKWPGLAHGWPWIRRGQIYWQTRGTFSGDVQLQSVAHPHHLQGTQSSTTPVPQHSRALGQGTSQTSEPKKQLWKLLTSISSLTSRYYCARSSAQPHQGHLSGYQVPLQIITELQKGVSWVLDQSTIKSSILHAPIPLLLFSFPSRRVNGPQLTVSSHLTKLFMSKKHKLLATRILWRYQAVRCLQIANFSLIVLAEERGGNKWVNKNNKKQIKCTQVSPETKNIKYTHINALLIKQ